MKKLILMTFSLLLTTSVVYSGGIVTNTNQSAAWVRMLVRDATTEIDAVYYNPAGLTKLADGWHFSISNQMLTQERTVESSFPYLNDGSYVGEVKAPIFPTFYAAYKTGKFAFSFGFNPVGGGGGATFENGLPTMEIPVSTLVPALSSLGVTGYSANMRFEGVSVYFGFQGGISYEINENLSVFAGARYLTASTTYEGYLKDITLTTAAGPTRADAFLTGVAAQAAGGAAQATGVGNSMDGIFALGIPSSLTFAQAVAVGLPAATSQQLQGALLAFGFTSAQIAGMSLADAQNSFYGAATALTAQANQLNATAMLMGDQEADVKQTGSGVTPIIGANLSFLDEDLNIGLKYEFKTNMDLTNETAAGKGFTIGLDPNTGNKIEMFPNGGITNADMPAMLSVGVDYKLADPLKLSVGYHTYFDGKTGWAVNKAGQDVIDKNSIELGIGLEYRLSDKLAISGGYLRTVTGTNALYHSDITHVLSSNSGAFGGEYRFSDRVKFNLGVAYTKYTTTTFDKTYNLSGTNVPYKETYGRNNLFLAFGLDFSIFK